MLRWIALVSLLLLAGCKTVSTFSVAYVEGPVTVSYNLASH